MSLPVTARASSAVGACSTIENPINTISNSNNNDMVFIPPKTPVRSKTKDTQGYHTPSKLVTKSGMKLIYFQLILSLLIKILI
jgi:hypothetical protein